MEKKHNAHSNGDNTANRGFASMPHKKVVEIARKGGEASHGRTAEKGQQEVHAASNKGKNEEMAEHEQAGGRSSGESKRGHKEEQEE